MKMLLFSAFAENGIWRGVWSLALAGKGTGTGFLCNLM